MSNRHDIKRDAFMLHGPLKGKGYDWWWHSFTGVNDATGEEKQFFVEYFTVNPGRVRKTEVILGQDEKHKALHDKPSYGMIKAGTWGKDKAQINRYYPWSEVKVKKGTPFEIKMGESICSENRIKGSVQLKYMEAKEHPEYMSDFGTMEWDLNVDKRIAFNVGYGASGILRHLNAFEMYWHAEGIKTCYTGYVIYNGERYTVSYDGSYGYADKNWGSDFTSPWVWLSSCNLESELTGNKLLNSAFDIGGGRPVVLSVPLERKLLGQFTYEGVDYEYNFSKFWTGSKTEFSVEETDEKVIWHVKQENRTSVMVTDISCRKEDMLFINYESPDGEKRHKRLFNGGTGEGEISLYRKSQSGLFLIDRIRAKSVGCEYGEY
ncbi:MAG: hypothetical protein MJ171_07995 [Clostridia bacterium]|nr:hypothetical protein [Clostridia bacterium]